MKRLRQALVGRSGRGARRRADGDSERIPLIGSRTTAGRPTRGKLNLRKLPTLLKVEARGRIRDAITLDRPGAQSFVWSDDGGRKMFFRKQGDTGDPLSDVVKAMMDADGQGLAARLPDVLFVELAAGDDRNAAREELARIDPLLRERIVFVGASLDHQAFTAMRAKLERGGGDRVSNAAYRRILVLLERAIAAENEPRSRETVTRQLDIVDAIEGRLAGAISTHFRLRGARNAALDDLAANLGRRRATLETHVLADDLGAAIAAVRAALIEDPNGDGPDFLAASEALNALGERVDAVRKERKAMIDEADPHQVLLAALRGAPADDPDATARRDQLERELREAFDAQQSAFDRYAAGRRLVGKLDRIRRLERENGTIDPPGALTPFIRRLKADIGIIADPPPMTPEERAAVVERFAETTRRAELHELVSATHLDALKSVSRRNGYTLSIRETGALSVRRIEQGAKPKPHTILEKSIKPSSIDAVYGSDDGPAVTRTLDELDLLGFVGHWREGRLAGLRVDGADDAFRSAADALGLMISPVAGSATGESVEFDLRNADDVERIRQLVARDGSAASLYTGDYDMHEAYQHNRQIAEGSAQKRRLIQALNDAIARAPDNARRTAEVSLDPETELIHVDGPYAMFQHGDQATYRMNQILEARARELDAAAASGDLPDADIAARRRALAELVVPVATESDEPLVWFDHGRVYVTRDKDEHALLREELGLTKPSTWRDELVVRRRVESVPEDKPFPDDPAAARSAAFRRFREARRARLAPERRDGPEFVLVTKEAVE